MTKCRRDVFTKEAIDDLRTIFTGVCLDFGAELSAFDGEHDHVHRLVNDPPKVSVSVLVNSLKGVSSRMIGQKQSKCFKETLGQRVVVTVLFRGIVWRIR